MTHAATLLLSLAGLAALALATARVQDDLFGRALAARAVLALRTAGWGALLAALGVVVRGQGWGLGLVSYAGHTSLAAGLVYLALVIAARRRVRR